MSSPFVLLTAPEGNFYAYVLRGLAEGFETLGVACLTQNPAPDISSLSEWARKFRPAAVFEINRVLPAGADWPRDVPHLVWLQDHRFNGEDLTKQLGVSDHLYFIVHPDSFGVTLAPRWPWSAFRCERSWSILLPGARSDAPAPTGLGMRRDYSMTGYIPEPLIDTSPVSYKFPRRVVTLREFLKNFPTEVLSDASFSMRAIHEAVAKRCREIGCRRIVDRGTLQTFDEILVRTLERRQILENLIATGGMLEIFGPSTWKKWPQFVPYYRGNIADPRQLDVIYQTTRVNVHNSGLTMHFRVMDCLAAGGFMLINETPWDFMAGGIRQYLEPSRHYGAYKIKEVAAVAEQYLADQSARQKISAEGRRVVLAEHTWRERARQVMKDIGLAPSAPSQHPAPGFDEARRALVQIADGAPDRPQAAARTART